jgi:hypothetical protein
LSNPCYNDGLCIILEENNKKQFKCLCPYFTSGKYCQIKIENLTDISSEKSTSLNLNTSESNSNESNQTSSILFSTEKNLLTSHSTASLSPSTLGLLATTSFSSLTFKITETTNSSTETITTNKSTPTKEVYLDQDKTKPIKTTTAFNQTSLIEENELERKMTTLSQSTFNNFYRFMTKIENLSEEFAKLTTTTTITTTSIPIASTTTLITTSRIERSKTTDSILNSKEQKKFEQLVSVERQILNQNSTLQISDTSKSTTIGPVFTNNETCNYDTCQLGKCLQNGTCFCAKPAYGPYCDLIDECLILKCVHVSLCVKINFDLKAKTRSNLPLPSIDKG